MRGPNLSLAIDNVRADWSAVSLRTRLTILTAVGALGAAGAVAAGISPIVFSLILLSHPQGRPQPPWDTRLMSIA